MSAGADRSGLGARAGEVPHWIDPPRRGALSEAEVTARVAALLGADPVCMGKVNKATVRAIAQIVAYPAPVIDRDVAAEREACARLIAATAARLATLAGEDGGELVGIEAARLHEAAAAVRLGLHR